MVSSTNNLAQLLVGADLRWLDDKFYSFDLGLTNTSEIAVYNRNFDKVRVGSYTQIAIVDKKGSGRGVDYFENDATGDVNVKDTRGSKLATADTLTKPPIRMAELVPGKCQAPGKEGL